MQQYLRPFDDIDPTYTMEGFLKANKARTAGPEQVDSPHHDAWRLKRIALIQIALIGPARLPLELKKNCPGFCRDFQKHSITNNHKCNYF